MDVKNWQVFESVFCNILARLDVNLLSELGSISLRSCGPNLHDDRTVLQFSLIYVNKNNLKAGSNS